MNIQRHMSPRPGGFTGQQLTERELEILQLAGKGLSRKGIAQILGIGYATVSWHLKNSYQKLQAGSREEALRKARARNLIESLALCQACACLLDPGAADSRAGLRQQH